MKKLTLLVAFFVCAIGFSQTTSLSDWAEQNPQTQTQNVTVEKSRTADASTNASTMGTNNPTYVQAISNVRSEGSAANVTTMGTNNPVDYRQVTPNTNSHVRTNFDSTSFTSEEVRGVNVNIGDAGTATRTANSENHSIYAVTITHSNTQTIEAGAEIACASPTSYRNNSIFRDFDLAGDFGITDDFVVTDAEIAIGAGVVTPNGFPLVVNVYSTTTGSFPGGTLTLQGTGMVTITAADSETMISVPVSATIPAGESMIYEVLIVDDGTDTNFMRFGANNDGQTGPSYIMALDCGAPDPIDMAVAFGLSNSFVMNIVGDVATGGGASCSEENLSNAFENAFTTSSGQPQRMATDITIPMDTDMLLNTITANIMVTVGSTITEGDIVIYNDLAGLPDPNSIVSTQSAVVPTSNTVIGGNFGLDVLEVVFDITPEMLTGQAGVPTTYWISFTLTSSSADAAYWEGNSISIIGNESSFSSDSGATWGVNTGWDQVYLFEGDCSPIGGGGADCSASNPGNAFENGRGNNAGNGWTVATDMIVPMGSDMMLNQVTTFQFMNPGITVVSADITLYGDNAGVPDAGNVITTETLAPTSNTVVGSNFGFDISEVVFDIAAVALAGNVAMDMTYWVAVQVTTSDGTISFWENSTASMVGNPQAFNDGAGWIISDATQESVYVFTADCSPIGGGGADCSASNPSNAFENGRGNNAGNGWTVATDMIVPMGSDMMLNQVTTFQFMNPGITVASADITIYGDNAGVPDAGNVITTETLAPTSNTVVGSNFGFDVSEVVFDIAAVALAGDLAMDMTYWVAVQVTTSDGTISFWENSTASMVGNPQAFNDGAGWIISDATQESVYVFTADCSLIPPPTGPVNDLCSGAIDINCGDALDGTTIDATIDTDVAPECDTSITAPGVWYVFNDTSGLASNVNIITCGGITNYDTKISVYTGDCGAPPLTCVVGNDDSPNCSDFQSEVDFVSDGNTTFYILVHGFSTGEGDFTITMSCDLIPPPNDLIVNTIDVDEIGFPYTDPSVAMPAATTEAGNPTGCNIDGAKGVWYNFTAAGDGWATATIITPGGVSAVNFYSAPNETAVETDLTLVDHPNNQCLPSTTSSINTVAGQAYYVFVVNDGAITDIEISGNNLSIGDNTIEGFSFYPNPSSSVINLSAIDNIETVVLYNVLGQKVIDQTINATTSQVNVSDLTTGTYFMKVSVNGVIGTYKVLKN